MPVAETWSVGAPVGIGPLVRSVTTMDEIFTALQRTYSELTLQCAVASLGHYVPAMRGLPGFEQVHRQNYEVSYHLTTGLGAARRILAGAREPGYFALVVACQQAAREHQNRAMQALRQMAAAAPADLAPLLQRLSGHMQATAGHLQRTAGLTQAALGQDVVQRLLAWSRSVRYS